MLLDDSNAAPALNTVLLSRLTRTAANGMNGNVQDVMRLDNSARMNKPGRAEGNWAWRVGDGGVWDRLSDEAKQLKQMAELYDRLPDK